MAFFIILLLSSLGLSGYFAYLVVTALGISYFWLYFLFIIPSFFSLFWISIGIVGLITLFLNNHYAPTRLNRFLYFIVRNVIFMLCFMLRLDIHVTGKELIDKSKCSLIVSNHINFIDPMLLIYELKYKPLICISKKQNFSLPIAGKIIRYTGFLSVDREDNRGAIELVKKASSILDKKYGNVFIAPEGTRNKTSEPILPMHAGSFKIATEVKAPIVVVCIRNTNEIIHHFNFCKTRIYIDILKTIDYEEYKDMTTIEIKDTVETLIRNKILESRK